MSSLSREDIERIAQLAALHVDAETQPVLMEQIARILDYVSQLQAVETSEDATSYMWLGMGAPQPLRADEVGPPDLSRDPKTFAPAFQDGLFVVPKLKAMEDV